MVDLCPVVKWWSETWTEKSLFMVKNVWYYSNGPPNHMTLPFEYRTPILPGIQVFDIQMVTVLSSNYLSKSLAYRKLFKKISCKILTWSLSSCSRLSLPTSFFLRFSICKLMSSMHSAWIFSSRDNWHSDDLAEFRRARLDSWKWFH